MSKYIFIGKIKMYFLFIRNDNYLDTSYNNKTATIDGLRNNTYRLKGPVKIGFDSEWDFPFLHAIRSAVIHNREASLNDIDKTNNKANSTDIRFGVTENIPVSDVWEQVISIAISVSVARRVK